MTQQLSRSLRDTILDLKIKRKVSDNFQKKKPIFSYKSFCNCSCSQISNTVTPHFSAAELATRFLFVTFFFSATLLSCLSKVKRLFKRKNNEFHWTKNRTLSKYKKEHNHFQNDKSQSSINYYPIHPDASGLLSDSVTPNIPSTSDSHSVFSLHLMLDTPSVL